MKFLTVLMILMITVLAATVCFADTASTLLKMPDGELYYETAGSGQALIWLHGGYGDRRMWDDQFAEFAEDYRVVRYDQRGFGKSPEPKAAYSPVADLLALLDHLKIEKAYLIGNSMGGILAVDFLLTHPGRVLGIVVVASGAGGEPFSDEDRSAMTAAFQSAQKGDFTPWLSNTMVAETRKYPNVRKKLEEMVEENSSIFKMKFWPSEKMDPPAAARLQEISRPVLVIAGEKDSPQINQSAKRLAEKAPDARIVYLRGTDHLPHMEKPAEFNTIVKDFLRRNKD